MTKGSNMKQTMEIKIPFCLLLKYVKYIISFTSKVASLRYNYFLPFYEYAVVTLCLPIPLFFLYNLTRGWSLTDNILSFSFPFL